MSDNIVSTRIKLAIKSASDWSTANPVLLQGEVGLDSTNKIIKVGDGVTAWNSLDEWNPTQIQSDWDQSDSSAKDFIKNKPVIPDVSNYLPLSGGTMTGSILYNKTVSDINTKNTISDSEIKLEYYDNASSHDTPVYQEESYIKINPSVQQTSVIYLPYIELHNKQTTVSTGAYAIQHAFLDSVGLNVTITNYDSQGTSLGTSSSINLVPGTSAFRSVTSNGTGEVSISPGRFTSGNGQIIVSKDAIKYSYYNYNGVTVVDNGVAKYNDCVSSIRDRVFGTCNILDMASLEQGYIKSADGLDGASTSALRTNVYISVSPSTAYTLSKSAPSGSLSVRYYGSSKNYLSSSGGNLGTFTTPSNCYYIRVECWVGSTVNPSEASNWQLEKGSTASPYVPYAMDNVELTEIAKKSIYAKTPFTPTNCTAYSGYGNCFYFKENDIVHLHIGISGLSSFNPNEVQIGTLPQYYRPSARMSGAGLSYGSGANKGVGIVFVDSDGKIYIIAPYAYNSIDVTFLAEN